MQTLSDHTATLNQFIQLFDIKNEHGYKMGGVTPVASCYDTDAIPDESHEHNYSDKSLWSAGQSRLTTLFELTENCLSIYSSNQHRRCIKALIDSCLEHQGLLFSSYKDISADYRPTLGKLKLAELHRARTFLIHNGPVLGLSSRSSAEFKWVICKRYIVGDFAQDDLSQSTHLKRCFHYLLKKSEEVDVELEPLLLKLSSIIFEEGRALRTISALKVKRILRCNQQTAIHLSAIYNALPTTPLH